MFIIIRDGSVSGKPKIIIKENRRQVNRYLIRQAKSINYSYDSFQLIWTDVVDLTIKDFKIHPISWSELLK